MGWEPFLGEDDTLPGHYKIGFSYEHAPRPDNLYDDQNVPYPISGRSARMRRHSFSTWLMMDQRILHYHETKTKDSGLTLMAGAIHNAPYNALRDYEFYGAVVNRGFIPDRPYDSFGLAFTYVHIANSRQQAEFLLENSGQPYPSGATGLQMGSEILEATYSIHVSKGIVFAPDMQYYIHPNGQKNLRNSIFIGFKSHIVLF